MKQLGLAVVKIDWLCFGRYEQAQDVAERLVKICAHHEYFPSMNYAMAAVTALQLTRGDVVQADTTFMEHLKSVFMCNRPLRVALPHLLFFHTHSDKARTFRARNAK